MFFCFKYDIVNLCVISDTVFSSISRVATVIFIAFRCLLLGILTLWTHRESLVGLFDGSVCFWGEFMILLRKRVGVRSNSCLRVLDLENK